MTLDPRLRAAGSAPEERYGDVDRSGFDAVTSRSVVALARAV
ncbi:hypothetical protein [Glycomyces sp. L485]|nr:hypothetical protein [Glycomyces sp. L485]